MHHCSVLPDEATVCANILIQVLRSYNLAVWVLKLPLPALMNNFKQRAGWHWSKIWDPENCFQTWNSFFSTMENPHARQEKAKPPTVGKVHWPIPTAQQAPRETHSSVGSYHKFYTQLQKKVQLKDQKLDSINHSTSTTLINGLSFYTSLRFQVLPKISSLQIQARQKADIVNGKMASLFPLGDHLLANHLSRRQRKYIAFTWLRDGDWRWTCTYSASTRARALEFKQKS